MNKLKHGDESAAVVGHRGSTRCQAVAEAKAKIDKAKARVSEALRKELAEKRHQLQKAEQELASSGGACQDRDPHVPGGIIDSPRPTPPGRGARECRRNPRSTTWMARKPSARQESTRQEARVVARSPSRCGVDEASDHDRLESLEKKLAKLLDEVASLKKHEKKDK